MEPYGPVDDDDEVSFLRRWLRPLYRSAPPIVQDFLDRVYDSLLPPRDDDLLLEDEEIYYKSRRHVAEIIQPSLVLLATIILAIALLVDLPGVSRTAGAIGLGLLGAALLLAVVDRDRQAIRDTLRSAIPWMVAAAVVAVLLGNPFVMVAAVFIWAGGYFGLRLFRWRFFRALYLTNRRLIQTEGFLSRRQATLPLSRVTDVALSYTLTGEYLGYATFRVESAGQTLFRQIEFLKHPEEFHRMVIFLATTPRPLPPEWPRVIDPGLVRRSDLDRRRQRGR